MQHEAYLSETQRKYDVAAKRATTLRQQIEYLRTQADALDEVVRAYKTILDKQGLIADSEAPGLTEPLGFAEQLVESSQSQPDDSDSGVTRGEPKMPQRRPAFERKTNREAIEALVVTPEFQTVRSNDDYANEIWLITNSQEGFVAKRTFNGELSRAVNSGILLRVGRGLFIPIDHR